MDTILKKIFDKWFRYKIKKEWHEKIKAYHFTEDQEKELAKDVASAVKDCTDDAITKVIEELEQAFWLVDTTIQDTIDRIEDEQEVEEQEAEQDEPDGIVDDDTPWYTDMKNGDPVVCNYKDKSNCSCLHKHPHFFDGTSCGFDCAYANDTAIWTVYNGARCVPSTEFIEGQEVEITDEIEEVMNTGGL